MKITHKDFERIDHIAKLAGVLNTCANYVTDAYSKDMPRKDIKNDLEDVLHKMWYLKAELDMVEEIAKKYGISLDYYWVKPVFKPKEKTN